MSGAHFNILVGVLALQLKFVTQEQLFAAVHRWTSDKARPLDEVFIEQSAIDQETRNVLVALVQQHLRLHGGDVEKSLHSIEVAEELVDSLAPISDSEVVATMTILSKGQATKTADKETLMFLHLASLARHARPLRTIDFKSFVLMPKADWAKSLWRKTLSSIERWL